MARQPLTLLPRTLIDQGFEGTSYHRVYHAVLAGSIPAQQGANGRWSFDPADLPEIAKGLGVAPAPAVAA